MNDLPVLVASIFHQSSSKARFCLLTDIKHSINQHNKKSQTPQILDVIFSYGLKSPYHMNILYTSSCMYYLRSPPKAALRRRKRRHGIDPTHTIHNPFTYQILLHKLHHRHFRPGKAEIIRCQPLVRLICFQCSPQGHC